MKKCLINFASLFLFVSIVLLCWFLTTNYGLLGTFFSLLGMVTSINFWRWLNNLDDPPLMRDAQHLARIKESYQKCVKFDSSR
jgi:hypothetical protein